MRSPIWVVNTLWNALDKTILSKQIKGGIHKFQRPIDSKTEDIVINCLALTGEQIQTGVANVNFHIPDEPRLLNGFSTRVPDAPRLDYLMSLGMQVLEDIQGDDYRFSIQQMLPSREDGESQLNFRIDIFLENIQHS